MLFSAEWLFILLILFQIKHFVGDFPLQKLYMLQKTRSGWDFALPLASHCLVHAILCLAIILPLRPDLWWLAILDFVVHFIMDRIKSGPKYLGRYSSYTQNGFWHALGFDQMVHHLTGFYIIYQLAS
jgi:hypothetical protein